MARNTKAGNPDTVSAAEAEDTPPAKKVLPTKIPPHLHQLVLMAMAGVEAGAGTQDDVLKALHDIGYDNTGLSDITAVVVNAA